MGIKKVPPDTAALPPPVATWGCIHSDTADAPGHPTRRPILGRQTPVPKCQRQHSTPGCGCQWSDPKKYPDLTLKPTIASELQR